MPQKDEAAHDNAHEAGEHSDSNHADDSKNGLLGVSGLQGLSAVSPEDEAALVGHWAEPARNP